MPCLNEARTLAACIQQAHTGCQTALSNRHISRHALSSGCKSRQCDQSVTVPTPEYTYEILIADNGSTDGSPEIAVAHGARVVHVEQKGYGAALRGGIAAARGKYIVMGDSDCSYDFGEVPRFIDKLEEGYDLVMGNRFAGGIMPGAMPWHHRYIGNPVLSGLGRLLYHTPCRDWHCGLRAFDREKIGELSLECTGMEFASEMVIKTCLNSLRIAEVPITLRPDGRDCSPHLRSFRDGWRHLLTLLKHVVHSGSSKSAGENSYRRVIYLLSGLLLAVFGAWLVLAQLGGQNRNKLLPRLTPELVQVGPIDPKNDKTVTVVLRNQSQWELSALQAIGSCGCARAEFSKLTIHPGSETSMQLLLSGGKSGLNREIPMVVSYEISGRLVNELLIIDSRKNNSK
jgi:hypothetical protein